MSSNQRAGMVLRLAVPFGAAVAMFAAATPARAIPAFAHQTGQPCTACHVGAFGPELTSFGRQFKLNGYVWGDAGSGMKRLSAMIVSSFTDTGKGQVPNAAPHFGSNDNVALDAVSLFYGGRIYDKVGAMAQLTYDGIDRRLTIDNTDVRFATPATILGSDTVLGISVNNNPTMSDLWNTTPAWGYPYLASGLAPTPAAGALIDGALGQQVIGASAYAMWDDLLYLELGGYMSTSARFQSALGVSPEGESQLSGVAPYWRVALQKDWGEHYAELGTYGLVADVFPGRDQSAGKDHYADVGVDANYQFTPSDKHVFALHGNFIAEHQDLAATYALGGSANTSNDLRSFRINGSYTYDQTWKLTLGFEGVDGSTDTGLYAPDPIDGSANGKPDSRDFVVELDYVPFGKEGSWMAPWVNARLSLQYIAYTEFNGGGSNYDGFGRDASDNNTLFAALWLAF